MKKNNINTNELEYTIALNRLEEITKEENLLKEIAKTKNYTAHLKLTPTFPELLISIKRENDKIYQELIKYTKKLYISLEKKINYSELLTEVLNNNISNEWYQNKTTKELLTRIKELLKEQDANNYLFQYIYLLMYEKEELLERKNNYENKETKRKRKFFLPNQNNNKS